MLEYIFFGQLLGIVATGGFVGEWYRSPCSGEILFSNVGGSAFLSFLMGWGIYEINENKSLSLIAAGLLAFQDIEFIKRFVKNFALKNIKILQGMLDGDDDDDK